MADGTVNLASCLLYLLENDFGIVHREGVKHQVADALSRPPTAVIYNVEPEERIMVVVRAMAATRQILFTASEEKYEHNN